MLQIADYERRYVRDITLEALHADKYKRDEWMDTL